MLLLTKFRINGHSMSPFLKDKDLIIASYIPFFFKNPKINDVVVVKYDNKILVKRVKKIKENKYFIKGDNKNDSWDSSSFGLVKKKDILGKFLFKLKNA